tara:strand:+ start:519 stop:962 length:444 start_codon:yes stop_codon:yes gene_type:complete
MEQHLKISTFLAAAEMIAAHLRIKESDRWTPQICKLKYVSFQQSYPEVNDPQFLWAAEKFVQTTNNKDFLRYPTWDELMSHIYRNENGRPNRSWGFKEDLPAKLQPNPRQRALMPQTPKSNDSAPDPLLKEAYEVFKADRTLPSSKS